MSTMTQLQAAAFAAPLIGQRGGRVESQAMPPWAVALSFNR